MHKGMVSETNGAQNGPRANLRVDGNYLLNELVLRPPCDLGPPKRFAAMQR